MNGNALALGLLKVAVPLGVVLFLLNILFDKADFSIGLLASFIVLALGYAFWSLQRDAWFNRLRAGDSSGLKALIAAGKPRFLLLHGALSYGLALVYIISGADWLVTGVLPTLGGLLLDMVAMSFLGALCAHYDWQKFVREVG